MRTAAEAQRALGGSLQHPRAPHGARVLQQHSARLVPRVRQCGGGGSGSSSSSSWTARVVVPVRSEAPAALPRLERPSPSQLLEEIVDPVAADMETMNKNLRSIVGDRHPMLLAAADQIFGAGGKKLRPMIVLLMARATAEMAGLSNIVSYHRRLAEIIEMIHTASLVHDDVLDNCSVRRGKDTVNTLYGTRVAVLVGDFLFAQSSWYLANLDNLEVIKLISQVIADFANGEISQAASLFDTSITLDKYLDKSFYKTASLVAASCRSSAVFSGMSVEVKEAMYDYGKHLGLAFQIVDDILDFTQTSEQLGKPQGQDLASGNLTAPVIFALPNCEELEELIQTEFSEPESLQRAIDLVVSSGGVEAARRLAREEADKALAALAVLPPSRAKRSLELMVDYVLDRIY
ncbi:octaprenyl-diphosphate synthase [Raphidocelis subcapitata]|uniref:Octaprenyl-diphosphate synthase n=1 Tax=Raphidocelis subcapitata TaxID=307507 RepID=A0A2V0NYC4_9CHLO|nr:octaprenyl-diphosphate synthase [Raphidocelis subcapitata]|eukprot:GBF89927.1 octaprenyl-diphosphate synthase [Raphidocelis subcapitata]